MNPGDNWTDSDFRVFETIKRHGTKMFPISRSELCARTNLSDRTVRQIKQRLIMTHRIRVETNLVGGGYYIPEDDDPDSCSDVEYKRAKTLYVKVSILRGLTAEQAAGEIQQALSLTTKDKPDG